MTKERLTEIATGLYAASTWVTGTRATTLVGYAEELEAAGTKVEIAEKAPAKEAVDKDLDKAKAKTS